MKQPLKTVTFIAVVCAMVLVMRWCRHKQTEGEAPVAGDVFKPE